MAHPATRAPRLRRRQGNARRSSCRSRRSTPCCSTCRRSSRGAWSATARSRSASACPASTPTLRSTPVAPSSGRRGRPPRPAPVLAVTPYAHRRVLQCPPAWLVPHGPQLRVSARAPRRLQLSDERRAAPARLPRSDGAGGARAGGPSGRVRPQAVAFFMTPRAYIRLACLTFLASVLAAYWAVFIPWVSCLAGLSPYSLSASRNLPASVQPACFPAALLRIWQGVCRESGRQGGCMSGRAVDPRIPAMAVFCMSEQSSCVDGAP